MEMKVRCNDIIAAQHVVDEPGQSSMLFSINIDQHEQSNADHLRNSSSIFKYLRTFVQSLSLDLEMLRNIALEVVETP